VFEREKRTERVSTTFATLPEPWAMFSGAAVDGYEIRHGAVVGEDGAAEALPGGRGFAAGSVLGLTVHGALESPAILAALVGARPKRSLDAVFDGLADMVERRLDIELIARLAGVA
jgi:adenosylcobyric acid synthase